MRVFRSECIKKNVRASRTRELLRRSLGVMLCATLAQSLTSMTFAQAASAPSTQNNELAEIIVTGSLLRRTDTETESPVSVFTAESIQQAGLTTIADVVRSVSADNSGTIPTAFGAGFAAGSSGVALRGLTVNSTLVLIDGRRAAPYALADDGQRSFVDLNTIPLDAVERVEVLKDGASSIYGADAIAGVVNVILKKQYQGAEIYGEVGKGQHPGGNTQRVTASLGKGDLSNDRYNAYFNFEYQGDARILGTDRPFPYNTFDLSSINGVDGRAGYPGTFSGTTTAVVAPATPGATPTILNSTLAGPYRPLSQACSGQGNTAVTASSVFNPAQADSFCLQNRAGFGDFQPAQQRIGASARFTIRLSDSVDFYTNTSFNQNTVVVDGAPSSIQASVSVNTNNIALPPTLPNGSLNPNDPFAAQGQYALIQYAFGDIPATLTFKNHNLRWVTGLKGSMWGWDFDTGLVIHHTWLTDDTKGLLNAPALEAAVTNGTYNFVNPSANSPAVRAAIAPDLIKTSTTDMDSLDFKATHNLFDLPGGPFGIALGGEIRYEAQADPALNPNGVVQGLGIAQTAGSRRVEATYFELGAPILKQLNIDVLGRYDHYSDFGSAFTPKVGLKFTPIKEVALRGTYSKGFRAPAFAENGSSSSEGFFTVTPSSSFPPAFCAQHSAAYCLPYSIGLLAAANPNIQPEKSDSYTLGLILEPIEHLSASIDAYAIKKKGVIEPPNTGAALGPYLNGQPLPPGSFVIPDLPDPANPAALPRPAVLGGVYVNEAALQTDGVDIDIRGNLTLGDYGKWVSDLVVTKIFSFKLVLPDGSSQQYVGTQAPYILSSGAGTPRYRGTWTNSYQYGPASVTMTTYYTSGFASTAIDATGSSTACLYNTNYCHVASFIDMDLTTIYKFNEHLTTTFTIANLLDRLPPINPADYAGVNYNPTYHQAGIIGQFFKVGLGYKF